MTQRLQTMGLSFALLACFTSFLGCDDKKNAGTCYTPCKAGAVIDGEYVLCSDEGLMKGCVGNTTCKGSWCIYDKKKAKAATEAAPPVEETDTDETENDTPDVSTKTKSGKCVDDCDCAAHGTCDKGQCKSVCEDNSECKSGKKCHKAVCRLTCSSSNDTTDQDCPVDTTCVIGNDGVSGHCMPKCAPDSDINVQTCLRSTSEGKSPFEIKDGDLEENFIFINQDKQNASFMLVNNTQCELDFLIRKASHSAHTEDGVKNVENGALNWITIGSDAPITEIGGELLLAAIPGDGGTVEITLDNIVNPELSNWNGVLEIVARGAEELTESTSTRKGESLGIRRVNLSYSSGADGQWGGKMYYFGNFGTDNLDAWIAETNPVAKDDLTSQVGNALIRRWGVLKRGGISLDNFIAGLTSLQTESWKWANVKAACKSENGACYPFADPDEDPDDGVEELSDDVESSPPPSGIAELPFAMNVREQEDGSKQFAGKIVSQETLHYVGDPNISFSLALDADSCEEVGMACRNDLTNLSSAIVVGGRFVPGDNESCSDISGYVEKSIPWLVGGFIGNTYWNGLRRDQVECRDTLKPFDEGSLLLPKGANATRVNTSYAGSNPLPNGQSIQRTLSLVDGAIFDKNLMLILFKESFQVAMSDSNNVDFSGYGFMLLRRSPNTIEEEDFIGSEQVENRTFDKDKLSIACSQELLDEADVGLDNPNDLASTIILGTPTSTVLDTPMDLEDIHYLCEETGEFGGGFTPPPISDPDGGVVAGDQRACPVSSRVKFFYFTPGNEPGIDALPIDHSCNTATYKTVGSGTNMATVVDVPGTCATTLQNWEASSMATLDPAQRCADEDVFICDGDVMDRRIGKDFFAGAAATNVKFRELRNSVYAAFRYKTAFRSRAGKNLGFTPEICSNSPGGVPYCYDPQEIEQLQSRMECAMELWTDRESYPTMNADLLGTALTESFKTICIFQHPDPEIEAEMCLKPENQQDGLEALYAELVIMLGDDAYTNSFASRFDLAGQGTAAFEGEAFEEGGINLSGAAGYEMFNLYQAVQYYQLALDRFYSLMPAIYQSMREDDTKSFITAETVTTYLDRLIRASTQKARTWAEITKRYQSFNQPDLARRVIERAYTSSYLESMLITSMMREVTTITRSSEEAQILAIIDHAQLRYKASLLELSDIMKSITDDVNFFGYPPEYIPFPSVDEGDYAEGNINAFDKLRDSAMAKLDFAAAKEETAIASKRDYEVDSASFQAELSSIRSTYENDLADICGTFEGDDGNIYPAIPIYGYLHEKSRKLQDSCGLMGNGELLTAMKEARIAFLEVEKVLQQRQNKLAEIDIEISRASKMCNAHFTRAHIIMGMEGAQTALQGIVDIGQDVYNIVEEAKDDGMVIAGDIKCSLGTSVSCPQAAISMTAKAAATGISTTVKGVLVTIKHLLLAASAGIELGKIEVEAAHECNQVNIDSFAAIQNMVLELLEIDYDLAIAAENQQISLSGITSLQHKAKRLQAELAETEQHAINIEAARNDPNVRIYKNDSIINADKAFWSAVREAYKVTKVYEYYTSTTYAHLIDLFLVRMVTAGDYNLENYLMDLDAEFYAFEEQYGNPDVRLSVISLRDNIFEIPRLSADNAGVSLSEEERAALFTEKLLSPDVIDANGYIRIPFSTQLGELSPLTRNHKTFYIEAEIQGENTGDATGRIYLTQKGTGTVRKVDGDKQYYIFPERISVIDTFFNGEKEIDSDTIYHSIYRSDRFIDRPFANSNWELVFNGVDETVNLDIDLGSITDIRLYVYYTDFTRLP